MDSKVQLVKKMLKYTFGVVPIVAGLDKFTNILTDWSQYISDDITGFLPVEPSMFMIIAGIIEIIAGILVLTNTKFGAYVVSAWLMAIGIILIISWNHVDVAVRDIVMAIAAFSLAKLTEKEDSKTKK